MESSAVVIDTSIFIEYLRAPDKQKTTLFNLPDNLNIFISAITLYELLMGAVNKEKLNDIQLLTSELTILPFNQDTANTAAELYHDLRKRNKMIEFRDLFIAATAISNNLPLLTLNKKHFERIKGINIL